MDLTLKIDSVENITKDDFMRYYFHPQKPVIIKDLINNAPAKNKWSLPFLKQKLGSTVVDVFDNRQKKNSAYTIGDLKMPFSEFIDIIEKEESCPFRLFLFNGFKYCPELKNDFPCPDIFKGVLDNMGFMFFGGKSTDVRTHFDIDMSSVLHTQFAGKKRVLLFSQEYSDLLYKVPFNTYSIADFDKPDYSRFPGLRYVKGYDVTLEHGDSLFMPTGYWHYMRYLEGGFAVTYRKMAQNIQYQLNGLMNLTVRLWFDKLMNRLDPSDWKTYKEKVAVRQSNAFIEKIEHSLSLS
jgi:hypothetical protein